MTVGLDRVVEVADDVLARRVIVDVRQVFSKRLASYGQAFAMQQPAIKHALHKRLYTADFNKFGHQVLATRLQVGQHGVRAPMRREIIR